MPNTIIRDLAIDKIKFARNYSLQLIEATPVEQWFWMPAEGISHIAWQVGHLAMAQYGLTMIRMRGKLPEDAQFIDNDFLRTFKKGSTPVADPQRYPSPQTILDTFHAVHAQAVKELPNYSEDELAEKLPEPHAVFDTKMGSLLFCSAHELIHAGQIGLLRRLMGEEPLR